MQLVMRDTSRLALLVSETGSPWQGWPTDLRRCADEVIVLAQHPGESLQELAHRVRSGLASTPGLVVAAAMVTSGDWSRDSLAARLNIFQSFVPRMIDTQASKIFLDGVRDDNSSYGLAALASVLQEQLAGSPIKIYSYKKPTDVGTVAA